MLVGDMVAWATTRLGIEPCPNCIKRKEFLNKLQVWLVGRRVQKDGSIIHPVRGNPPTDVPEGYVVDPNDPYIFRIALEPCSYRTEDMVETGCCPHMAMVCSKYERRTDRLNCKNCVTHGGNQ